MKDLQHFQGMLDMDGSNELTQQQFSAALDKNRTLHKQVGCSVRVHCMFKVQVAAQRRIEQEQHPRYADRTITMSICTEGNCSVGLVRGDEHKVLPGHKGGLVQRDGGWPASCGGADQGCYAACPSSLSQYAIDWCQGAADSMLEPSLTLTLP